MYSNSVLRQGHKYSKFTLQSKYNECLQRSINIRCIDRNTYRLRERVDMRLLKQTGTDVTWKKILGNIIKITHLNTRNWNVSNRSGLIQYNEHPYFYNDLSFADYKTFYEHITHPFFVCDPGCKEQWSVLSKQSGVEMHRGLAANDQHKR